MNTGKAWCNKCDPGRFLSEGITSGNNKMDKLICEIQKMTEHYHHNLEWISYDKFEDIKHICNCWFCHNFNLFCYFVVLKKKIKNLKKIHKKNL